MIRRGDIEVVHPGVARLAGTQRTDSQRIAAAVWSLGGLALASHRSALHLHGVPGTEHADPVDVILPGRSRKLRLDGVVTHRPTDAQRLAPQRRQGIRCTDLLRTLVDVGAVAPEIVHGALGHVLSSREVTLSAVAQVLVDHGRRGRSGVGALRQAFDDWAIDGKPADSVLEGAFRRLVERFGLPEFEFHSVIEGWEVDFRLSGSSVIIECDGWTTHGLVRSQFERDRRRDDDLASAGWTIRRFTYRAIVEQPADTARRIRRAVERSRPC